MTLALQYTLLTLVMGDARDLTLGFLADCTSLVATIAF